MSGDFELLAKLQNRDQRGLEEAIHRYASYVSAVVRRTLGPFGEEQDTEEVVSDVFVALWQKAGQLRDDSSLKYWLAVVARNAALKRLGRARLEEPLEENAVLFAGEGPEGPVELEECRQQVRKAVDGLEEKDREIFLRHYFWYQSVSQIAREMELNESTVKTRLRRGREKLKEKLVKEDCSP